MSTAPVGPLRRLVACSHPKVPHRGNRTDPGDAVIDTAHEAWMQATAARRAYRDELASLTRPDIAHAMAIVILEPPEWMLSQRPIDFLKWCPGVAERGARSIVRAARVDATVRLGEIQPPARERLAIALRQHLGVETQPVGETTAVA